MRILLPIALLLSPAAVAQNGGVQAQLDRQQIRIGEPVVLDLSVDQQGGPVIWPVLKDTLTAHIEVVKDGGVDTVQVGGNGPGAGTRVVRRIVLTAFDTGFWAIPPLRVQVNGEMQESKALLLRVQQGIDVPKGSKPADIKPIHEAPMDPLLWALDHWIWIAGVALTALVAVAIVLFMRRRKRAPAEPVVEVPPVPLHERVLAAMDALERERLWQLGEHKAYQSRLTDLVRGYIEERFQVPALERTTDELMKELRVSPLTMEQQALLGNMLRLADMVKFAKALPAPQENEQMLISARRFVLDTANTIAHEARA